VKESRIHVCDQTKAGSLKVAQHYTCMHHRYKRGRTRLPAHTNSLRVKPPVAKERVKNVCWQIIEPSKAE
jgi:hypothetical protein